MDERFQMLAMPFSKVAQSFNYGSNFFRSGSDMEDVKSIAPARRQGEREPLARSSLLAGRDTQHSDGASTDSAPSHSTKLPSHAASTLWPRGEAPAHAAPTDAATPASPRGLIPAAATRPSHPATAGLPPPLAPPARMAPRPAAAAAAAAAEEFARDTGIAAAPEARGRGAGAEAQRLFDFPWKAPALVPPRRRARSEGGGVPSR